MSGQDPPGGARGAHSAARAGQDAQTDARPGREIRIDLAAYASNIERLRAIVAPARTMAVVKADAYGHGALPIARAAVDAGADFLGVADVAEALQLRAAGIDAPLLAWLHPPGARFAEALAAGVELGVSSLEQLESIAAAAEPSTVATVHLKLDTGLGRNGATATDAPALFDRAHALETAGRIRVRGLFSHLSGTSVADDREQLAVFAVLVDAARAAGLDPELRHLAASAAALTIPETRLDLVRLGIAGYGLQPDPAIDVAALGLRPVMELSAAVAAVKRVPAGQGVSYGYRYRAERETTLALVPLGYADGVPRAASGSGPVVIGGRRFVVAGRVAMDQFVVDVGDAPVRVGDRAVLWGDPAAGAPSASDWAEASDSIPYEMVTRVGARPDRTLVDRSAGEAAAEGPPTGGTDGLPSRERAIRFRYGCG